jgi:hypothetical protein
MTRDWTVTQCVHRPSVPPHLSLRTDRQPIFSKWPQPFGHSMPRRVLRSVRYGSMLLLFFQLPFVPRLFAPRQCGRLRPSVSFLLQLHPSLWSCSYEKSH